MATRSVIRRLWAGERDQVRDHLLRLDREDRGIGTALLRRLITAARNRLIKRIYMVCLMDKSRAVRMARGLDGALEFHAGTAEAWIEPPWPTPWTWLEELLFEPALTGIDDARSPALTLPAAADGHSPPVRENGRAAQVMTEGTSRPVRSWIPAT
jgi:hypothetical protein